MEVLTYISCMDMAYVPKLPYMVQDSSILGNLKILVRCSLRAREISPKKKRALFKDYDQTIGLFLTHMLHGIFTYIWNIYLHLAQIYSN